MANASRAVDYCEVAGCDREAFCTPDAIEPMALCEAHTKRQQRGLSLAAPIREHLAPRARLDEAALALADAETDEEFEARSKAHYRAALSVGVRAAMAAARARGVRFGPAPALSPSQASAAVRKHGGVSAAAEALGVCSRTVRRALLRGVRQRTRGAPVRLSKAR